MYQEKIQRKTAAGPSYDWSGCGFQVKVQWTEGLRFQGFSVFLLTFAALFPVDAGFQLFFIGNRHGAAGEGYNPFFFKVFQHPRDDFPRASQIPCNLFMGCVKRGGVRADGIVQQVSGKPLVKAGKQNLIHRPHDIGKMLGGLFINVIFHINVPVYQGAETGDVRNDQLGILVRLNLNVKGDFLNDTGGGEGADLAVTDPKECDFSCIARLNKDAQLAFQNKKDSETVIVVGIEKISFPTGLELRTGTQQFLLLMIQMLPERVVFFQIILHIQRLFSHSVPPTEKYDIPLSV